VTPTTAPSASRIRSSPSWSAWAAIAIPMLFDPGHSLDERILREQFGY